MKHLDAVGKALACFSFAYAALMHSAVDATITLIGIIGAIIATTISENRDVL